MWGRIALNAELIEFTAGSEQIYKYVCKETSHCIVASCLWCFFSMKTVRAGEEFVSFCPL